MIPREFYDAILLRTFSNLSRSYSQHKKQTGPLRIHMSEYGETRDMISPSVFHTNHAIPFSLPMNCIILSLRLYRPHGHHSLSF